MFSVQFRRYRKDAGTFCGELTGRVAHGRRLGPEGFVAPASVTGSRYASTLCTVLLPQQLTWAIAFILFAFSSYL